MSYPFQIKSEAAYHQTYQQSVAHPEQFWEAIAQTFQWQKKWDQVLVLVPIHINHFWKLL